MDCLQRITAIWGAHIDESAMLTVGATEFPGHPMSFAVQWRAGIRIYSAALEGMAWTAKAACVEIEGARIAGGQPRLFSDAEMHFLKEEEQVIYRMDDRGRATELRQALRIRTRDNLRFAFSMLARATGKDVALNGDAWTAVCRILEVRDALTHPKEIPDLVRGYEPEEGKAFQTVLLWMKEVSHRIDPKHLDPPDH